MIEPKAIEQPDPKTLKVTWRGGHVSEYPVRALRLACPCAGCVEEWTGRPVLDPASVPEDVAISTMDFVGRYALAFVFSDGHPHGIYSFQFLRALCPCEQCVAQRSRPAAPPEAPA
jgi:ATP-binding protein involved in chromosome partitioning